MSIRVERKARIRTYRELAIATRGRTRIELDGERIGHIAALSIPYAELTQAMTDGRLWAVTYHTLGGAENGTGYKRPKR